MDISERCPFVRRYAAWIIGVIAISRDRRHHHCAPRLARRCLAASVRDERDDARRWRNLRGRTRHHRERLDSSVAGNHRRLPKSVASRRGRARRCRRSRETRTGARALCAPNCSRPSFASTRANVQQAEAALETVAAAFRRAKSLSTSGVLSQADLDQLRSDEVAAQARVHGRKGRSRSRRSCDSSTRA